jgi:hypothetical protein
MIMCVFRYRGEKISLTHCCSCNRRRLVFKVMSDNPRKHVESSQGDKGALESVAMAEAGFRGADFFQCCVF